MSKDNGGPAFPVAVWHKERMRYVNDGMALRDYFAAKAMASCDPPEDYVGIRETLESFERWANKCYRMADAMLKAREA